MPERTGKIYKCQRCGPEPCILSVIHGEGKSFDCYDFILPPTLCPMYRGNKAGWDEMGPEHKTPQPQPFTKDELEEMLDWVGVYLRNIPAIDIDEAIVDKINAMLDQMESQPETKLEPVYETCPSCGGAGEFGCPAGVAGDEFAPPETCQRCHGTGAVLIDEEEE